MDPVKIRYMKERIAQLPGGNITYKTIRSRKYAYLQWTESGKQRSRRVKDEELQELTEKIRGRKALRNMVRNFSRRREAVAVCNGYLSFKARALFFQLGDWAFA